jgi:hypothetical protein
LLGDWPSHTDRIIRLPTSEIESSRYPLSARIMLPKRIRAKLFGEEPGTPQEPGKRGVATRILNCM